MRKEENNGNAEKGKSLFCLGPINARTFVLKNNKQSDNSRKYELKAKKKQIEQKKDNVPSHILLQERAGKFGPLRN